MTVAFFNSQAVFLMSEILVLIFSYKKLAAVFINVISSIKEYFSMDT